MPNASPVLEALRHLHKLASDMNATVAHDLTSLLANWFLALPDMYEGLAAAPVANGMSATSAPQKPPQPLYKRHQRMSKGVRIRVIQ